MKLVVTVPENVIGMFHTYQIMTAAISLFIDACNQVSLRLKRMCKWSRSLRDGTREGVISSGLLKVNTD
jgi:hypothetical protein